MEVAGRAGEPLAKFEPSAISRSERQCEFRHNTPPLPVSHRMQR
jgi:hypothetical protein